MAANYDRWVPMTHGTGWNARPYQVDWLYDQDGPDRINPIGGYPSTMETTTRLQQPAILPLSIFLRSFFDSVHK